MMHFHRLMVSEVRKETDECVVITFAVPEELKETFRFTQGQNLTFRKTLNGTELRRNYSVCTSPLENKLQVAVKKVEGGAFSTWANEKLKPGDELDVMPPSGKFYTPLHPQQAKNYLAFAAGSGITPLLSIIKTTLLTEPKSSFTLVYGNRTKGSIIFKEDLQYFKDRFIDRFRMYHILSREVSDVALNAGRIDKEKLELLFSKVIDLHRTDEFFACGPEEMIFSVRDFLADKGVANSKIHFELFTVPGQKQSAIGNRQSAMKADGPVSKVSVKLDGVTFGFDLAYGGPSILDAALVQGADLPYACKGGVCTTCKAKVLRGEVRMDANWGLEPDEVEAGYVLTCQAHPVTDSVLVDFDAK